MHVERYSCGCCSCCAFCIDSVRRKWKKKWLAYSNTLQRAIHQQGSCCLKFPDARAPSFGSLQVCTTTVGTLYQALTHCRFGLLSDSSTIRKNIEYQPLTSKLLMYFWDYVLMGITKNLLNVKVNVYGTGSKTFDGMVQPNKYYTFKWHRNKYVILSDNVE